MKGRFITMISDINGELNSQKTNSRLPSLLALRCFEAAARLENFSRAADELHLTHGAVSRAVRLLEDDLGIALFERRSRRVYLTDAGRQLSNAVAGGFGLIRNALSDIRANARKAKPWVLSCEPTLLMRWLIPRWPSFQAQHPDVDIHLMAGGGEFSFAHGIDFAIRRNDFSWPASYQVEPLFTEKIGPVCRPDKVKNWFVSDSKCQQLHPETPLLHTSTRPTAWSDWSRVTRKAVPKKNSHLFEHFYFSLQASVAGLGVAIGPWHLVCNDLQSGLLAAPLGFVNDGSQYCLFSSPAAHQHGPQAILLDWLKNTASPGPLDAPDTTD